MASENEAIIAAAGSGKTERILDAALADQSVQSLIVTYTTENLREINSRLWTKAGGRPTNVATMSWFEFLLRHGVKPYQSFTTSIARIRSVNFVTDKPRFAKRENFDAYYLDGTGNVYRDAVSDLAFVLDDASGGKVTRRLEGIFRNIFVDEVQDLAGYDLEFLQLLLSSTIKVVMVGDPRQVVYLTNNSNKNKQFRGAKIVDWMQEKASAGLCIVQSLDVSYRCNQAICDFADGLFPALSKTKSANFDQFEHTGVFLVHEDDLAAYLTEYGPQELRWDRRNRRAGPDARNFGQVKGQSFDRVVIHPTSTITSFIEKGADLADVAAAKFYVAVTRARHSVAIVTNKRSTSTSIPFWSPDE